MMLLALHDPFTMSHTIAVDGKDLKGNRVCVSIDDTLFNYFAISTGGAKEARATIRNWIAAQEKPGSKNIRDLIYSKVIKPSLIDR